MRVVAGTATSGNEAFVEFRLRYDGPEHVMARVESLPGERLFAFARIRAESFPDYDAEPFVRCPEPARRIVIDDPGVGLKRLEPGQELVQRVELFDMYENLDEVLGKCDLVLYWTQRTYLVGEFEEPRMAGTVVFPKSLSPVTATQTSGSIRRTDVEESSSMSKGRKADPD